MKGKLLKNNAKQENELGQKKALQANAHKRKNDKQSP
jgi:hypothetical protein